MTHHPHSCRGWADREGPCGAGDCWTCHPSWQYETDPAAEDEEDDLDARRADFLIDREKEEDHE